MGPAGEAAVPLTPPMAAPGGAVAKPRSPQPGAAGATQVGRQGSVKAPAASASPPVSPSPDVEDMLRADKTGAMVMAARREVRLGQRDKARQLLQQVFALEPTDCGA